MTSEHRTENRSLVYTVTVVMTIAAAMSLWAQDAPESPPIDPELERPPTIDLSAETPAESTAVPQADGDTDRGANLDPDAPIPPKVQDDQVEPTVVIREEEDRRIEEYSINGQVYMVKVTPDKGPPFYYIDTDGDGTLELDERSRALHPVQPAYWKIAEWD